MSKTIYSYYVEQWTAVLVSSFTCISL